MRRTSVILFAGLLIVNLMTFAFNLSAHADTTWTLKADNVNLNLKGVSPYVEKLSSGDDRLYFPSVDAIPDNIMVTDCTNSGACTRKTIGSKFGFDPTIVTLKNGTRKVFFVESTPSSRSIKYATLNSDGLSHGEVSDLAVQDSSINDKRGWGVPDAVVKPDGNVKIFWVNMDLQNPSNPPEFIISATSTDTSATKFTRDNGIRIKGYVDTKILKATPGDWVMICATGPNNGAIQKLYMATSPDGNNWTVNPNPITDNSESAFDPTGYQIDDNTWRIYYASAAPGKGETGPSYIKRATLTKSESSSTNQNSASPTPMESSSQTPTSTPTPSPSPNKKVSATPTPTVKSTTITCVKGKITKKVTGINPKCPSGYAKKG